MKVPRYWAKGNTLPVKFGRRTLALQCWRWSDQSVDDAQRQADSASFRLTSTVAASGEFPSDYLYGDGNRPLREELVRSIPINGQNDVAVITRNLYGALVINAAQAMFIDIDYSASRAGTLVQSVIQSLFRKKKPPTAELKRDYVDRVHAWADRHKDFGLRLYRTFAGLRCLVTNHIFDPHSQQSIDLLNDAGSDPLYVRLCQAQGCFRARVSPKPWRCAVGRPPRCFPRTSPDDEQRFRAWQAQYEQAAAGRSVCQFLEQIGPQSIHPQIQPILDEHDRLSGAQSSQPLA